MRSYEAARSLFSFLAFVAWSLVVIGVLIALVSAAGVSQYAGSGAGLFAMVPGIGIGITGFILVAFIQMGRATVDTAEYTQQMLKIARDQLDVSKQGLNQGKTLEQGFAALKPMLEEKPTASFANATTETNNAVESDTAGPGVAIAVETEPEISHEVGETIEYRGKNIRVVEAGYTFAATVFETLGKAKDRVDEDSFLPPAKEVPMQLHSDLRSANTGASLGGVKR